VDGRPEWYCPLHGAVYVTRFREDRPLCEVRICSAVPVNIAELYNLFEKAQALTVERESPKM
jgi:uncharacterized protein YqfB (UPF0267 family)